MKNGKKQGNLAQALQKKMAGHKSSLNTKGGCQSNVRHVGLKAEEKGCRSNILLFDSCYTCPLSVYIDITADEGKLKNLIIKGNPTNEELEEARFRLVTEFSEISNSGESAVFREVTGNFYKQRALVLGYELSLKLLLAGRFRAAVGYLNKNGLNCQVPETEEEFKKLAESISLKIKNRTAKYKEAESAYKALSSGKGEKPTRRYYNRLLVILSTCEAIKIQLNPKKMTVAEFAEYLNMFNEYRNHLKMKRNG